MPAQNAHEEQGLPPSSSQIVSQPPVGSSSSPDSSDQPGPTSKDGATNGSSSGDTQPGTGGSDNQINADIVGRCEGVLERFRRGEISKSVGIGQLTFVLGLADPSASKDSAKEAALAQYVTSLNAIGTLGEAAERRGAHATAANIPAGDPISSVTTQRAPIGELQVVSQGSPPVGRASIREVDEFLDNITSSKRAVESDEESFEDQDDLSHSNKKQRLRESDLPWFGKQQLARIALSPSCTRSREILERLSKDPTFVKRHAIWSPIAPAGFPASEWDNIIAGKPINLDKVFSALHLVAPVKENVGRLGGHTFHFGDTEPARKVASSGDWISAWYAASSAYRLIFEHRTEELQGYADYILREFSSKVPEAHYKIILYDAAVRELVGGGTQMLLTDFDKFRHIYSAIVLPDGIQARIGRKGASTGSVSRTGKARAGADICRRFNSEDGCPDEGACRYRHGCSICGKSGHSRTEHEDRGGKGSKSQA